MRSRRRPPKTLLDMVVCLDPKDIYPPHEAYRPVDLDFIRKSMARDGWTGRPLPVEEVDGEYFSVTGAHRLQAAVDIGLPGVPAIIFSKKKRTGFEDAIDQLMNLDQIIDDYAGSDEASRTLVTSDRVFLKFLRDKGIHPELIKVLKMRQWDCNR